MLKLDNICKTFNPGTINEKKALQNDIKEIYEEAKSANFDVKAIKQLLKIRKMDDQERQEEEFVLDVYKRALGLD